MDSELKIGFDAKRIVRNATGLGSYGRTLVNDLAAVPALDLTLYAPDEGRIELRRQVQERDNLHYHFANCHTALGRALWRSRGIISQMRREGIQVYHGLSGELPVGIGRTGIKSVVTIHDLIFLRHPEYYKKVDVRIYTRKFRQALKEADRIVAISECTRRDICELGGVDKSRVSLIYQSCSPRFSADVDVRLLWQVRDKYELPDRYVLSVGSIEERKNVLQAVRALHYLPDDVSLVIVGRQTDYTARVYQYILDHRLVNRVLLLHGVTDTELPAFYRMADAFVYPSRYEGFGIPIIEAISAHLPVVACTGSCLEEAGGPDSLYVKPDDDQAMANAISRVLFGAPGRQQRIERSLQYISRFRNTDAAQHFVDLYNSLL